MHPNFISGVEDDEDFNKTEALIPRLVIISIHLLVSILCNCLVAKYEMINSLN